MTAKIEETPSMIELKQTPLESEIFTPHFIKEQEAESMIQLKKEILESKLEGRSPFLYSPEYIDQILGYTDRSNEDDDWTSDDGNSVSDEQAAKIQAVEGLNLLPKKSKPIEESEIPERLPQNSVYRRKKGPKRRLKVFGRLPSLKSRIREPINLGGKKKNKKPKPIDSSSDLLKSLANMNFMQSNLRKGSNQGSNLIKI